jgi:hypothetical protein
MPTFTVHALIHVDTDITVEAVDADAAEALVTEEGSALVAARLATLPTVDVALVDVLDTEEV